MRARALTIKNPDIIIGLDWVEPFTKNEATDDYYIWKTKNYTLFLSRHSSEVDTDLGMNMYKLICVDERTSKKKWAWVSSHQLENREEFLHQAWDLVDILEDKF
jgi:hypothetical protein